MLNEHIKKAMDLALYDAFAWLLGQDEFEHAEAEFWRLLGRQVTIPGVFVDPSMS